jgi:DNA gyrase subunit A
MIEEVEEIQSKFGDKRRTRIENVSGEVDVEDLIPVEDNVVHIPTAAISSVCP